MSKKPKRIKTNIYTLRYVTIRTENVYNLKKKYKVNKIWQNNVIPWNFPFLCPLTPSVHNCAGGASTEVGGEKETIVDEEKVKKNKMKGQGEKRAEK